MKSIKSFKYVNTNTFKTFLWDLGYTLEDIEGYYLEGSKKYHDHVEKKYVICFSSRTTEYYVVREYTKI